MLEYRKVAITNSSLLGTCSCQLTDYNTCWVFRYDVRFQEGMECGGAYIKLISEGGINQLTEFHDKTPYTIMFGPDKCGNDHKLHFIFRYKSPKSEEFEEKHMAKPDMETFKHIFTDKYTHLLTLSIEADSSFELSLDQTVIKSGSLLKDFRLIPITGFHSGIQ